MSERIINNVTRGTTVDFMIDGERATALKGETVASALLLHDKTACYKTLNDRPRMMFCNMGACFECRVHVTQGNESQWMLACVTPIQPKMKIDTTVTLGRWIAGGDHDV